MRGSSQPRLSYHSPSSGFGDSSGFGSKRQPSTPLRERATQSCEWSWSSMMRVSSSTSPPNSTAAGLQTDLQGMGASLGSSSGFAGWRSSTGASVMDGVLF